MTTLTAYIDGIGLLGPGFNNWPGSAAMLCGEVPYQSHKTVLPAPAVLPPAERRRCGPIVKLVLAIGHEAAVHAVREPAKLPAVFSASGGDGTNCHEICEMLASDDRLISPTRFHNSVHNAAAGYWSIAHGATASSSVLCAFDASFGAGLLEAMTQTVVDQADTLLVACDTTYPEPLRSARSIPDEFGVAMVLSAQRSAQSIAQIRVALTDAVADRMDDASMEQLRIAIPAARSLPLLRLLAQQTSGNTVIDYLHDIRLAVQVQWCS